MNKDEKTWFVMLDLADIVKDVVKHFGRAKLDKDQDVWAMINEENEFKKHTVREVIPYPGSARTLRSMQFALALSSVSRHSIFKPITRGYSAMARSRVALHLFPMRGNGSGGVRDACTRVQLVPRANHRRGSPDVQPGDAESSDRVAARQQGQTRHDCGAIRSCRGSSIV